MTSPAPAPVTVFVAGKLYDTGLCHVFNKCTRADTAPQEKISDYCKFCLSQHFSTRQNRNFRL